MSIRISRSFFLKTMLAAAGLGAVSKYYFDSANTLSRIKLRMLGPSQKLGHMLRDSKFKESAADSNITETCEKRELSPKILIVGAGIAGLSSAWYLQKHGIEDFLLLELESYCGGNSACGKNKISAYPWGAHYVPIANEESVYVKELFEELGIIETYNSDGLPVYNQLFLCHEPQERLFKDGKFHEGLVPRRGIQPEEEAELSRFFKLISELRKKRGKDGKLAFAIPLDMSSQDPEFTELDKISMAEWLKKNEFRSKPLRWYLNYCCRDDYGARLEDVSAWAGLHYFAGRRGRAANAENNSVLTWPEGNGFLVEKLKEKIKNKVVNSAMVCKIKEEGSLCRVDYFDSNTNELKHVSAEYLIFAAPRFLAKYIFSSVAAHSELPAYSPWLVANISLKHLPDAAGVSIAWDNVSYYSQSLGYVVATHQDIRSRQSASVITYYYPLSDGEPTVERGRLQKESKDEWLKLIVADLEKVHPGISDEIISVDIWPWGHGMVRPSVGFIWGQSRAKMKTELGNVYFAHSDMSGISNFEEAQYWGVEAARQVISRLEKA